MSNAEFDPKALHDDLKPPATLFDVLADEYRMYRDDTTSSLTDLTKALRQEYAKNPVPVFSYLGLFAYSLYNGTVGSSESNERLMNVMINGGVLALHGLKSVVDAKHWSMIENLSGPFKPESESYTLLQNGMLSDLWRRQLELDRGFVSLADSQQQTVHAIYKNMGLNYASGEVLALNRGIMHVAAIANRLPGNVDFSHG